jgi:iron complex transport system substrate-binding protein
LTLDDTYAQIEQLGAATGHIGEAAELVTSMQTEIEAIVAANPVAEVPLTFYHELDPTLYSADSTTFIGEIYSLLGLQNIADRVEGDSGGFPQLSAEFVVSADPDLIFLADTKCCAETAESVGAREGWAELSAVQNGNVIEMDDDIASRWGPRIVEYLAAVAAAVQQASVPACACEHRRRSAPCPDEFGRQRRQCGLVWCERSGARGGGADRRVGRSGRSTVVARAARAARPSAVDLDRLGRE